VTARTHRSLPLRLRLAFVAALGCTACAELDFDDDWSGEPYRGQGGWSYPLPYRGHHAHRPPPRRDPCHAHGSGRHGGCGDARAHHRRPDGSGHRHDAGGRPSEHPRGGERDGRPRSVSPGPVKAPAASPPRAHTPASTAPRPAATPSRPASPPRGDRRPERRS